MSDAAPLGHIKLARKAFDPEHGDELWLEPREFSRWEAWVDVIQLAAFRPRTHHSAYGAIALLRGEFVASLRWLASRWHWTVKRVRTWISDCEKGARLKAHRQTEAGTVYLIVNYDTYQNTGQSKTSDAGTPKGTDGAQQGHKKEAGKAVQAVKSAPVGANSLPEWVVALGGFWHAEVGRLGLPSIYRDCAAIVESHGSPRVLRAVKLYVAYQKATKRGISWKWFVDGMMPWIERAATPLTVIDGEMSDSLELLTRPA